MALELKKNGISMRASDLAKLLGGRFLGEDCEILGMEPLFSAQSSDLSFVIWPKDIRLAKISKAGCIVAEVNFAADYADVVSTSLIVVDSLFESFNVLKKLIDQGIFSRYQNMGNAQIGEGTVIAPNAVIEPGTFIDSNTIIQAGAVIKQGVRIGANSYIGSNSVIGGDGFIPYGLNPVKNLPSLGNVAIEDCVRIGSLCTVDRGLIGTTRIKKNTLIDNLVHVGHDVVIGENVIIAGQSGFAGFARIGDHVTVGGQAGVAPHIVVEEGARISGKSMVHCDIKRHEIWSGNPSVPHAIYLRAYGKLMNSYRKKRR